MENEIQQKLKKIYSKYEDQVSEGDLTKDDFRKIESLLMEVAENLEVKLF